ncbi:MAG: DUF975 family protein [Clostridium sp.]|nr:DUF975 family protein [Clostridium sp.]
MIKSASELRAAARQSLSGMWGGAVILYLVYLIIYGGVSAIPMVGSLGSLLLLPMAYGVSAAFLDNARTRKEFQVGDAFVGFSDYGRLFGTLLLQGVYVILWTMLLVVPGIIKQYSYAMTVFILKDEPELKYNAAIEKSMVMMDGHKWDYFCLQLSFIGWVLLACCTCGIGFLWLGPYMASASAHFYEEVKADYAKRIAGQC